MDPKMASLGSSALAPDRSPWHSPIPYLFGGLAAMLGLIAFALLILACSYWKLSRHQPSTDLELEAAEDHDEPNNINPDPVILEDKFLVIMAGENKPTFLATPASSRNSSFGSKSLRSTCCSESSTSTLSLDEDNMGSFRQIEMQNRDHHQQQHEASV